MIDAIIAFFKRLLGLDAGPSRSDTAAPPAAPEAKAPRASDAYVTGAAAPQSPHKYADIPPAAVSEARAARVAAASAPVAVSAPLPPEMSVPRVPAAPVAYITLGRDEASLSSPRSGQGSGPYRRPSNVPVGTFMARREGSGISLSQGGRRVSTVSPYDQAGINDLGLQMLTWQMLADAVEAQRDATVVIDDQHPGYGEEPDSRRDDEDVYLDPSIPTADEQGALAALEALGYDPTAPRAEPEPVPAAPEPAPYVPETAQVDHPGLNPELSRPVEVQPIGPTEAETVTATTVPDASDSWTPSGAYER